MLLYDWECTNKHKFEELSSSDTKELDCPTCGKVAKRQISAPRAVLEGVTGDFPGAAMKWERQHRSKQNK